jgi:rare lipoprotein A
MFRLEISSRGGRFGLITVLLTASAIQGCSMNSRFPDPTLQNRPEPLVVGKSEAPRFVTTPNNFHVGAASWYGPGFSGKKTASGDTFDETKFTAAHKTLPLGSKARITHLGNRKSVEVLINDRGPFVEGRMIDLSQAAAKALGMIDNGIAKVQVESLQEAVVAENAQNVNRQ